MKAVFIESTLFEKHRSAYLPDDEFQQFQNDLLESPLVGDVIQGTGGLRKVRVGNEMSDLTADQKHQLKTFVEVWRNEQA